jgi:hypothetical protein
VRPYPAAIAIRPKYAPSKTKLSATTRQDELLSLCLQVRPRSTGGAGCTLGQGEDELALQDRIPMVKQPGPRN